MTATKRQGLFSSRAKGPLQSPKAPEGRRKEVLCERDGKQGQLRGITVLSTKERNNSGRKEMGLSIFMGVVKRGRAGIMLG